MKLIIICILINIIALITSSLKKRSKSKSKKQFIIRRPYTPRPSPLFMRRTIVTPRPIFTPRPVFAIVRHTVVECPNKKGEKVLIGKSTGICKSPCNMKTCIQTNGECCFYAKPE